MSRSRAADSVHLELAHGHSLDSVSPTQVYGASFPPTYSRTQSAASLPPVEQRQNKQTPRSRLTQRTTKTTQKLVLFPEDQQVPQDQDFQGSNEQLESLNVYVPDMLPEAKMTEAERLSKDLRFDFPRVSSYCLAEGFKIEAIASHVKEMHSAYQKIFDECLYIYYDAHFKSVLFGNASADGSRPLKFMGKTTQIHQTLEHHSGSPPLDSIHQDLEHDFFEPDDIELPGWMLRGEVFVFDYGVIVLWNFTKREEERLIQALKPFAVGHVVEDDIVLEDLHYQYDIYSTNRPRMYSDMITLKSSSPLVKLTISHALAQSVKLAFFEDAMDETIDGTVKLPLMMAKYGQVKMKRIDIMKIVGQLFRLKMNVNLISNVLDTPEIFDSEPELKGLYNAIRGYMEISQRAEVLNTRADVVSDLLEMLSDHLNSNEMHYITWIIIYLICIAVVIAGLEVYVKYLRLLAGMDD